MARLTRMAAAARSGLRSRQEVSTIASRRRAACAEPGSRPSLRAAVPRAECRCSRQPRPRLGAACCRPGDDARPALTGRQQSPQVRQGVVLRRGRFRRRYTAAKESSAMAPRRRRHPSATPLAGTVTGTARGTNPAEPGRRPAARPERPCAPLACARTPPARGAPGWAHRFGSPLLPIKTIPPWVAVVTPLDPGK